MMSHEMSTGTIKSLIIAPVKRWKIYLAKYLSMLAVMLVLILYTYAVASLTNGLLFGLPLLWREGFSCIGRSGNAELLFVSAFLGAVQHRSVSGFYHLCLYAFDRYEKYGGFRVRLYGTLSRRKLPASFAGLKSGRIRISDPIPSVQQSELF